MTDGIVALLHERFDAAARPDELDALTQADEVSAALLARGQRVERVAVGLDLGALKSAIGAVNPQLAFNLVESLGGNGALIAAVPAMLAGLGIPTTGCDAAALNLSSHKLMAKRWLRRHGITTPDWVAGDSLTTVAGGRWIVKSVWEHASLGLDDGCVVNGAAAIRSRMADSRRTFGGDWFAERFVDGRELNVSVLEIDGRPQVLPIAEIEFEGYAPDKPRIVGYAAKWQPDAVEYHATRRVFPLLPVALAGRIRDLAIECWTIFGLSGYARVDIRLDAAGTPWILEINANPCLARDAGFCAAAEADGIDQGALIGLIVSAAVSRP